jgi:hypothetical protein
VTLLRPTEPYRTRQGFCSLIHLQHRQEPSSLKRRAAGRRACGGYRIKMEKVQNLDHGWSELLLPIPGAKTCLVTMRGSPHEARESLGRGLPSVEIDPANLQEWIPEGEAHGSHRHLR